MNKVNIGLIGLGTVGTGVVKILQKNIVVIEKRLGAELVLKTIADLDIGNNKGLDLSGVTLTKDADDIINDPAIDIVVELIGGYTPAKDFILDAIKKVSM